MIIISYSTSVVVTLLLLLLAIRLFQDSSFPLAADHLSLVQIIGITTTATVAIALDGAFSNNSIIACSTSSNNSIALLVCNLSGHILLLKGRF